MHSKILDKPKDHLVIVYALERTMQITRLYQFKFKEACLNLNGMSTHPDLKPKTYHINPRYWDREAFANSIDPDKIPLNMAFDFPDQ